MDRKSRKKVRKYVIIYLVYFVLFSVFMFVLEKYEVVNNRQWMFGLIAAHPELEAEIIAAWEKPENDKDDDEQLKILKDKYGYEENSTAAHKSWWCLQEYWRLCLQGIGIAGRWMILRKIFSYCTRAWSNLGEGNLETFRITKRITG